MRAKQKKTGWYTKNVSGESTSKNFQRFESNDIFCLQNFRFFCKLVLLSHASLLTYLDGSKELSPTFFIPCALCIGAKTYMMYFCSYLAWALHFGRAWLCMFRWKCFHASGLFSFDFFHTYTIDNSMTSRTDVFCWLFVEKVDLRNRGDQFFDVTAVSIEQTKRLMLITWSLTWLL